MSDPADYSSRRLGAPAQDVERQKAEQGIESSAPSLSLPKGGGAIRGMGEKFQVNNATGTGSMSVPLEITSMGKSRSGFQPEISLSYDSGSGNGSFGYGWQLSLPCISRKTDKGLPRYMDDTESDDFMLSGMEELVEVQIRDMQGIWSVPQPVERTWKSEAFTVKAYRPRIEGLFSRIERWTKLQTGEIQWRSISKNNVTTLYGIDDESRIFDPDQPTRIFSWLISETYDDKGNAIIYNYTRENYKNVEISEPCERNRGKRLHWPARYLKRIKYGNKISRLVQEDLSSQEWMFEVVFDYGEHDASNPLPIAPPEPSWPCRKDPFSNYRSGFEVRQYRLCQRILMFHHFPDEQDVGANCLVSSTDFAYRSNNDDPREQLRGERAGSFLLSISKSGYIRSGDGYQKRSMPALEFKYSTIKINSTYQDFDQDSLNNLPVGLFENKYQWADLDGEGISGILSEQGDGWFYRRNLGGKLGPLENVLLKPSSMFTNSKAKLMDIAGDGRLSLVELGGSVPGFFKRTLDENWLPFQAFASHPNINFDDGSLLFMDLSGDGYSDVLINDAEILTWYPSLAEKGFGPAQYHRNANNENLGPYLVTGDNETLTQIADMSGDGLLDFVRVRNGEVCYWPSIGYGEFGEMVQMGNSPVFDYQGYFDPKRIRFADIDGSGTTDIIYLGIDGIRLYFNQSGNSFGDLIVLNQFPMVDNISSVSTIDLFGSGTSCIVWSSQLPADSGHHLGYIDLLQGRKPHLLVGYDNNLGAEIRIHYSSSTKFYLQDRALGNPWVTKLAFPVHVVERTETFDHIARNHFSSRMTYHHGYFDGNEREFRGFGLTEQYDTEEFDVETLAGVPWTENDRPPANIESSYTVPPTLTRTWYHTGAYFEGETLSRQFEREWYAESIDDSNSQLKAWQVDAMSLPHTQLPNTIRLNITNFGVEQRVPYKTTDIEARESFRALKGLVIRKEIYALDSRTGHDGKSFRGHPYSITSSSHNIEILQPQGNNRHAVFLPFPAETVGFHYERKVYSTGDNMPTVADPRVTHDMSLEVTMHGEVKRSVKIQYGRRQKDLSGLLDSKDHDLQSRIYVTYEEHDFTNEISEENAYRTPLACEARTWEIHGMTPDSKVEGTTNLFRYQEVEQKIRAAGDGEHDLFYDDFDATNALDASHPYRRLYSHTRNYFRMNDLTMRLSLQSMESMALPYNSYTLALTARSAKQTYVDSGKIALDEFGQLMTVECGYRHREDDDDYWVPSGEVLYSPNANDDPAMEYEFARNHFFTPHRYRNQFHSPLFNTEVIVRYDKYSLLVEETEDSLGNQVTVGERDGDSTKPLLSHGQDYRLLKARMVMDQNRNRTAVRFDTLGMVVGTASMGKPEENIGDNFESFEDTLDDTRIHEYFESPLNYGADLLKNAGTRVVYDFFAFQRSKSEEAPLPPACSYITRDYHASDAPERNFIMNTFSYSNGFGKEIQHKIRAEAGLVPEYDPITREVLMDEETGLPKRTATDLRFVGSGWVIYNNKGNPVRQFEPFFSVSHTFDRDNKIGVSAISFYDPVGRVVAKLFPDHSWVKSVFDPWGEEKWDQNDTVGIDPLTDPDVGDFFRRLETKEFTPTWYQRRIEGGLGPQEKSNAIKAAVHAKTPSRAFMDSLGRPVVTVTHNAYKYVDDPEQSGPHQEYLYTRKILDIQGYQRRLSDAQNRVVALYDYDMVGNIIHQRSMEAGERWFIQNAAKVNTFTWDSKDQRLHAIYDQLGRQTDSRLKVGAEDEIVVAKTIFGSGMASEARNCCGRITQIFDQSGTVRSDNYDFKGNATGSSRQLARDYKSVLNWEDPARIELEREVFTTSTSFDARNRPRVMRTPDKSTIKTFFSEGSLLDRIQVNIKDSLEEVQFMHSTQYNEKGQRTAMIYGNGVSSYCVYDPYTFRLTRHVSQRFGLEWTEDDPQPPHPAWPGSSLQNLSYVYDPVGNISYIKDDAQQLIYFRNKRVEPSSEYTYDSLYRLINASGREHLGQASDGTLRGPTASSANDSFFTRNDDPGNGRALGRYLEKFVYDTAGNIKSVTHSGTDPGHQGWTRIFNYNEASQIGGNAVFTNQLSSTSVGSAIEEYRYTGGAGLHGCITSMAHLKTMEWDFRDQLRVTSAQIRNIGTPETTYYVYDSNGQRLRKVTERQADAGVMPTRLKERIYLGTSEIYREYGPDGNTITLERETLHVINKSKRVALVETRTMGEESPRSPKQLIRYQFGNNIDSASLELDEKAQIISYEEYTPYGSTSYQAVASGREVPAKRYRYTGKERDEESGFAYHGKRYYAPWLCRWISCDPGGFMDGLNLYAYGAFNPIKNVDLDGMQATGAESWETGPMWVPTDPNWVSYDSVREHARAEAQLQYDTIGMMAQNPLSALMGFEVFGLAKLGFEFTTQDAADFVNLGAFFWAAADFAASGRKAYIAEKDRPLQLHNDLINVTRHEVKNPELKPALEGFPTAPEASNPANPEVTSTENQSRSFPLRVTPRAPLPPSQEEFAASSSVPTQPGKSGKSPFKLGIVNADTKEELQSGLAAAQAGAQVTIANSKPGTFEPPSLGQEKFNLISEEFPVLPSIENNPGAVESYVRGRLANLKPGGAWIVVTESKADADKLMQAGGLVMGKPVDMFTIGADQRGPRSGNPTLSERFVLSFGKKR